MKDANLIWKFADQKVNVFGPAHTEKSHFKGVFECIFSQSFKRYGGNKSMKENSLRRGFKSLRTIDTRWSPERFHCSP